MRHDPIRTTRHRLVRTVGVALLAAGLGLSAGARADASDPDARTAKQATSTQTTPMRTQVARADVAVSRSEAKRSAMQAPRPRTTPSLGQLLDGYNP